MENLIQREQDTWRGPGVHFLKPVHTEHSVRLSTLNILLPCLFSVHLTILSTCSFCPPCLFCPPCPFCPPRPFFLRVYSFNPDNFVPLSLVSTLTIPSSWLFCLRWYFFPPVHSHQPCPSLFTLTNLVARPFGLPSPSVHSLLYVHPVIQKCDCIK
jgi:hypothetical protein